MKQYLIDEQSLKSLIQYLGTRPYVEVAGAIEALSKLPEHECSKS